MNDEPKRQATFGHPHAILADLATCLRFFSRLPVPPVRSEPGASHGRPFGDAIRMLPVAGLIIGACGAAPLIAAVAAGLPDAVAVVIGGACMVLATGGLHEDGLADMADGVGGGATIERKLAIMRDSRIGTFGVLAVVVALLLRFAALTTILDRTGLAGTVAAMLASAVLSRAMALLPLATLRPARPDGLGRSVGRPSRATLTACFVASGLLGLVVPLTAGITVFHTGLACVAAVAAAAGVTRLAYRHIGGHTGDIGGASQQASDVAYLIGLLLFPGHA